METSCKNELIPIRKVAERLAHPVCHATVYAWVKHGCRGVKLRSIRVGARHFIDPADLEQFLLRLNEDVAAPAGGKA